MDVTLGGDRLGSGNKQKIYLKNYERSTHDLSQRFTSTLGCGMLIPCLCLPALRGDVFDIKINGACRTLPTRSPLFSTFKMQVDILQAPIRLYQGILHNNPLFIGLKMSEVKFPKLKIKTRHDQSTYKTGEFACNALLKYLGLSGLGRAYGASNQFYYRKINAIPALAYYDIFKTYYSNKQEDYAYVIGTKQEITNKYFYITDIYISVNDGESDAEYTNLDDKKMCSLGKVGIIEGDTVECTITYVSNNLYRPKIDLWNDVDQTVVSFTIEEAIATGIIRGYSEGEDSGNTYISFKYDAPAVNKYFLNWEPVQPTYESEIQLNPFELSKIDDMRMNLLSYHTLGSAYEIDDTYADLPYNILTGVNSDNVTKNNEELNGIVVKTYQADLFNAWVNTEWLDGENGIAEMSKIAVSDGAIYMDALLLAEKTYNMLNRISVAGGTYEAWQDVVYTESNRKHIESPIYCGGLSNEIVFEEIIQTTPTESAPLGTLGGRGIAVKRKGGNVSIKVDEASFIMGIVSITPRVYYGQGNEFYMTELDSMDDLHKPALDGIGFQNLLGERMCWSDTNLNSNGTISSRTKVGKVPAWIEYMTAVDKVYGEFLTGQKTMVLNRDYEVNSLGQVQDFTTYIDPAKYNYAFADARLNAQNFWVQIDFDIKARRLMSAKQIPNL